MKKLLKLFITMSIMLAICASFCISSAAYGETEAETDVIADEISENIFTRLYDEVKGYATEILCAMTFAGSLLLAYAYKKGLIPIIEKTLLSIGNSVSKIKEQTEAGELAQENFSLQLTEKLDNAQGLVKDLVNHVNEMNSALNDVKRAELEREENTQNLSVIVSAQIDMLYDIFMTSALPQYQKDAVGERVAKMKEALRGDAERN